MSGVASSGIVFNIKRGARVLGHPGRGCRNIRDCGWRVSNVDESSTSRETVYFLIKLAMVKDLRFCLYGSSSISRLYRFSLASAVGLEQNSDTTVKMFWVFFRAFNGIDRVPFHFLRSILSRPVPMSQHRIIP